MPDIFYLLATLTRGRALAVIQRVSENQGCEAWRQLCREFEPRLPARFQGLLQCIFNPDFAVDQVETIYGLETRMKEYGQQSGDTVAESNKMAVLASRLVGAHLRSHLSLSCATVDLRRDEEGGS